MVAEAQVRSEIKGSIGLAYHDGMVLEELLTTIEELQTLIRHHGDELRHSEMATRYALINPLLRALGWKTQDPASVQVEKHLAKGRADYLLMGTGGRAVVLIEAKKLGVNLNAARKQASEYCNRNAIPCYAVTDGQQWHLYETSSAGWSSAKEVVDFDVTGEATGVAVKALALWQRNVERNVVSSIVNRTVSPPSLKPKRSPLTRRWRPFNTLLYMWGTSPHLVRLPDESVRAATSYPKVLCVITEWLIATGKLNTSQLPIKSMQGNRLIAVDAQHSRQTSQHATWRKIDSMYVEIPTSSATLTANLCRLITAAGHVPKDFQVQLSRP